MLIQPHPYTNTQTHTRTQWIHKHLYLTNFVYFREFQLSLDGHLYVLNHRHILNIVPPVQPAGMHLLLIFVALHRQSTHSDMFVSYCLFVLVQRKKNLTQAERRMLSNKRKAPTITTLRPTITTTVESNALHRHRSQ